MATLTVCLSARFQSSKVIVPVVLSITGGDPFVEPTTSVDATVGCTANPSSVTEPVVPPTPSLKDEFDDSLLGGAGNDLLMGGSGRDWTSGGLGADTFRFAGADFAGPTLALADVIADFSEAEGDRIDLSAIDALSGIGDEAFRFLGNSAFSGAGAELRTTVFDGYFVLEGDTNADGKADFAIRLDGLTTLSVGAIIV